MAVETVSFDEDCFNFPNGSLLSSSSRSLILLALSGCLGDGGGEGVGEARRATPIPLLSLSLEIVLAACVVMSISSQSS